jgi:DNA-binding GntR family transcriptional regulator
VVETALRTSIRFTNRFKGHSASLGAHQAVRDAIIKGKAEQARKSMEAIIRDVMALIDEAEASEDGALE